MSHHNLTGKILDRDANKYRRKYSDVIIPKKRPSGCTWHYLPGRRRRIPNANGRNNFVVHWKVILFLFDCMFVINTNTAHYKKGFWIYSLFWKKSIRVKVAQVLGCTYSDYIPRSVVVFKWCVCKQNFGCHIATPSRVHTIAYYTYILYSILCAMHFVYLISLGHSGLKS